MLPPRNVESQGKAMNEAFSAWLDRKPGSPAALVDWIWTPLRINPYWIPSPLGRRSSQEAGGLPHVEPSRQEETREEVHGGAQRHRRGLARPSQEGH